MPETVTLDRFQRKPFKLKCKGINLRYPLDLLPEGYFPIISNARPRVLGGLMQRAGNTRLGALTFAGAGGVHTIRRLNDPTSSVSKRIIGAGTSVYDDTSAVAIDTGWSGNPISMLSMRPFNTPSPFMYASDGTRSQKFDVNRNHFNIGIAAPTAPVGVARAAPNYLVLSEMGGVTNSITEPANLWSGGPANPWNGKTWTGQGQLGAPVATIRFDTGSVIDTILYDSGSTGWCLIKLTFSGPTNLPAGYQVGARIGLKNNNTGNTEIASIRQINKPITTTTIGSIIYDSGSTGLCSITLATPGSQPNLIPDTMVQLSAGPEYVRVLSTSIAVDGTTAFRCSTVNTQAAGNAVTGVYSFRIYLLNTYRSGSVDNAVNTYDFVSAFTLAATNTGWMQLAGAGVSEDCSSVGGRPIQSSDYVHFSFQINTPANLSRLRVYLNLDKADPAFSSIPNALYFQVPSSTITAIQGGSWNEIFFQISQMQYTGAGTPPSLGTITGIIIEVVGQTGAFNIAVGGLYITGTYGGNSKGLTPYSFYQRYRAKGLSGTQPGTGARSNPSPISRAAIDLWREGATITPVVSTDPQTDTIDLFVIGGTLTNPLLFASTTNSATTVAFSAADVNIAVNEVLEFNLFQPFPVSDLPRFGTCNVSGTYVTQASGSSFNTGWQQGSIIVIAGVAYTIYAVRSSTFIELNQNAGSGTGVAFTVPEATLSGQVLASVWGPDPITGVMFGCGHADAAGSVFWTNPNDPDTASDANVYQVTSTSEPLIAGFMYDGRSYVFSSEGLYFGYSQTVTNPVTGVQFLTYIFQEVPLGKGMFGIYAWAVGVNFYAVTRSGVIQYGTQGYKSITDDDLFPLFPHEGQSGTAFNGYNPIDFTQPFALRLYSTEDSLYFTFRDTLNVRQCFRYDIRAEGWWPHTYANMSPNVVYQEEGQSIFSVLAGGTDGNLYQIGVGNNDNGSAIICHIQSPAMDMGDPRAGKTFAESMIDYDPQGETIQAILGFDNYSSLLSGVNLLTTAGRRQAIVDAVSGSGKIARNISIDLTWSGGLNGVPIIYEVEPSWVPKPELIDLRATDWDDAGYAGDKYVEGCIIEADTLNAVQTLQVQSDTGTVQATFNIQHNGQSQLPYAFAPFIGHVLRLQPTVQATPWRFFKVRWIWQRMPELVSTWGPTRATVHGSGGYKHIRPWAYIALISTTTVTFTIIVDGVSYNFTVPSTAGVYAKQLVRLSPLKGLSFQYQATGTAGFRLFKRDSEVAVKAWGADGPFVIDTIFGGEHEAEAPI